MTLFGGNFTIVEAVRDYWGFITPKLGVISLHWRKITPQIRGDNVTGHSYFLIRVKKY